MMSRLKVWFLVGSLAALMLMPQVYADNTSSSYELSNVVAASALEPAQNDAGTLTVTVRDTVGQPAVGVKVSLGPDIVRYTDGNGKVIFSQLASGTFTITATVSSSLTANTSVTLMTGENKQVSLKLAVIPPSPMIGLVSIGLIILPLFIAWLRRQLDSRMVANRWEEAHSEGQGIVVGTGWQEPERAGDVGTLPHEPLNMAQLPSNPTQQLTPIDPASMPAASTQPPEQPPVRR